MPSLVCEILMTTKTDDTEGMLLSDHTTGELSARDGTDE